jgi:hypothetical protein
MNKINPLLTGLMLVFLLSGCTFFAQPSPTPTFPPTVTVTIALPPQTEQVPVALLPTITPSATEVILPTPITPLSAFAGVDNLVLRSGPGMLFENLGVYEENSPITVIGRSQGNGWYLVITDGNASGWMKAELVILQGEAVDLPYITWPEVGMIKGHVRTPGGSPASGIGVSLAPLGNDLGANIENALTDATGTFYLFFPENLNGEYQVGPNGFNCEGNQIIGKCELPYTFPPAQTITLPMDPSITLEFVIQNR